MATFTLIPSKTLKVVKRESDLYILLIIFNEVKGLYNSVIASSFETANQMALQLCGLGDLKPNTLMMGFKEDWKTDTLESSNAQVCFEIYFFLIYIKSKVFIFFCV